MEKINVDLWSPFIETKSVVEEWKPFQNCTTDEALVFLEKDAERNANNKTIRFVIPEIEPVATLDRGYTVHKIARVMYGIGSWEGVRMGVYQDGNLIGQYDRNYPNHEKETFQHFVQHDEDYALYSPTYTGTRVLKLPECIDIGGEDIGSFGFCPVAYYVPKFFSYEFVVEGSTDGIEWHIDTPETYGDHATFEDFRVKSINSRYMQNVGEIQNGRYAFVAGCVWGDDSSWKVQILDIGNANDGVVVRHPEMFYKELPEIKGFQKGGLDLQKFFVSDCDACTPDRFSGYMIGRVPLEFEF